jgi:hypothetical protein
MIHFASFYRVNLRSGATALFTIWVVLILPQAKPFAISLSVNIFLQSFVKSTEIANGRLCSATKLEKFERL